MLSLLTAARTNGSKNMRATQMKGALSCYPCYVANPSVPSSSSYNPSHDLVEPSPQVSTGVHRVAMKKVF